MASGFLSLLAEFREESSFLPPITFGYIYSRGAEIPVCSFGPDISYLFTGFSPRVHFMLAIISLGTVTGVYTLAKSTPEAQKIRNSAPTSLAYVLDVIVSIDSIFTFIAPVLLLLRVCNGDLISNTLLFIQVAVLATTLWSIILNQYTDVEGIKGISK